MSNGLLKLVRAGILAGAHHRPIANHERLRTLTHLGGEPQFTSPTMPSSAEIRGELLKLIGENTNPDETVKAAFAAKLKEYAAAGGESNDVLFAIGKTVYGAELDQPPAKKAKAAPAEELPVVDFDYMKAFMKDVFLSYGVTPENAEVCADVLIESDKRGIDSHGLGRLKPIYCDRMDNGILFPDKPIDIVSESETTALVDGNLGLGLYIGPHCMQMAIDKAKKHGVGFVAVKNSTHYGIAGRSRTEPSLFSNAAAVFLTAAPQDTMRQWQVARAASASLARMPGRVSRQRLERSR